MGAMRYRILVGLAVLGLLAFAVRAAGEGDPDRDHRAGYVACAGVYEDV